MMCGRIERRRRGRVGAAVACVIAGVAAGVVSGIAVGGVPMSSPTIQTREGADAAPQRLVATAYYGTVNVLARQTNQLKAKLTQSDGTPVPGLPIKFAISADSSYLCQAITNPDGYAECTNSPLPATVPLAQLLLGGYDAYLDGNARYLPVDAHNSVGIS